MLCLPIDALCRPRNPFNFQALDCDVRWAAHQFHPIPDVCGMRREGAVAHIELGFRPRGEHCF
jgi:hypothetical protein